jgi:hypothetical protein
MENISLICVIICNVLAIIFAILYYVNEEREKSTIKTYADKVNDKNALLRRSIARLRKDNKKMAECIKTLRGKVRDGKKEIEEKSKAKASK